MALRTLLDDHESGLHPFPIESAAFQAPAQTAGVALSPPELAEEQLPIPTAAEIKAHMAAVRAQRLAASGDDAARSTGSAWVRALFGFS